MHDLVTHFNLHKLERPFFIFSMAEIEKNLAQIKSIFSNLHREFSVSYSLKTNPNLFLVQKISSLGLGFDVSSLAELEYLAKSKINFAKVSFSGPGKTDEVLNLAAGLGVKALHIESIEELKAVPKDFQNLSIRLKTQDMYAVKLGMNEIEIEKAISILNGRLLVGLHAYLGRESFSVLRYQELLQQMDKIKDKYHAHLAPNFSFYIGPGLPHTDFKLDEKYSFDIPVHIEVGRALVASSGTYFAKILAIKKIENGRKVVIIEGGLQHLGSPMVSLNKGLSSLAPIFLSADGAQFEKSEANEEVSVFGSLCLWHDNLHPKILIPPGLRRGDWIGFSMTGAYGLTAGVPHFIGQVLPNEYILENNKLLDISAPNFRSYHQSFEAKDEFR